MIIIIIIEIKQHHGVQLEQEWLFSNARFSVDDVNGVDRGLLSGGDRRTRSGGVVGGRFWFVVVFVFRFPPAVDAR